MLKDDFISASIVTYNDADKAFGACRCLLQHTKRYKLVLYVFDNSPDDKTFNKLSCLQGVRVYKNDGNIGFGAAHNKVLDKEMGKYHFFVNPDITIDSDVLSDITDYLEENNDIALLMPNILNQDGSIQYLPKEKPTFKYLYLGRLANLFKFSKKVREEFTWADKELTKTTDIKFCSGCFFGGKTDTIKKLNGFDERYFMYLEDADITLRALKYGRVVIAPQFSVTHMWERESAKKIKYLLIHIGSTIKFLYKWRNYR